MEIVQFYIVFGETSAVDPDPDPDLIEPVSFRRIRKRFRVARNHGIFT